MPLIGFVFLSNFSGCRNELNQLKRIRVLFLSIFQVKFVLIWLLATCTQNFSSILCQYCMMNVPAVSSTVVDLK